mgnify:CR=1 FL=1
MKYIIVLLLTLLTTSCTGVGGKSLDCSAVGHVDLDATWLTYYYADTLVTWPNQGETEKREWNNYGILTIDQCGDSAVVANLMGGRSDTNGIDLYLDQTGADHLHLKYTITAEGYIDENAGWMRIRTDYSWVVYDTTYTIDMIERKYD